MDGNGEVKFLSKLKKINLRGVGGDGLGEVRGSKVWVRWVMLGMGDGNQE